eukprot:gnl/Dysnectes_brevis/2848_a3477_870.p1 GENE.gnl/Dysnectes_brevis/2848_a3477_870~~gnl/Dysnectes_brevis/2848_a3477_870.p1  ORF type:complete len:360 (+),score=100.75 gnl/Dysnectes_brevis/2848_a3477_870:88-1167(+)
MEMTSLPAHAFLSNQQMKTSSYYQFSLVFSPHQKHHQEVSSTPSQHISETSGEHIPQQSTSPTQTLISPSDTSTKPSTPFQLTFPPASTPTSTPSSSSTVHSAAHYPISYLSLNDQDNTGPQAGPGGQPTPHISRGVPSNAIPVHMVEGTPMVAVKYIMNHPESMLTLHRLITKTKHHTTSSTRRRELQQPAPPRSRTVTYSGSRSTAEGDMQLFPRIQLGSTSFQHYSSSNCGMGDHSTSHCGPVPRHSRLVWTCQLETRFLAAVLSLGVQKAMPRAVLGLMNVDGISRESVASHLQKFRMKLRKQYRLKDNSELKAHHLPDNIPLVLEPLAARWKLDTTVDKPGDCPDPVSSQTDES